MKIDNILIDRAVDLWCRKLNSPSFDNGDDSPNGCMCMMLATLNIDAAKKSAGNLDAKIEVFRESLTSMLVKERDSKEHFYPWLDVDYHPSKQLADAATAADIPSDLFSVKSTVSFSEGCVRSTFGYGAEAVFHYPLGDGRWLVTTLAGSDIEKVIDQVLSGNDMGLKVEVAS